jgi:hypothetical protein
MKRKAKQQSYPTPEFIHDLSEHLEYRVIETLKSRSNNQHASVFLAEVRRQQSLAPRPQHVGKEVKSTSCVIKIVKSVLDSAADPKTKLTRV